jgi:hypothetical protein
VGGGLAPCECQRDRWPPDWGWKRQAVSSRCSHSIEVFPELCCCWITRDLSLTRLINADFVAKRDFYFD